MKRIIVLVILLAFYTTAYATPFEATPYVQDENKLEIKGNARNSKVTLVITKSGTNDVIYADTALSDPVDGFSFILKPAVNGLLDISVTADFEDVGTKKTVSFVSSDIIERIENTLKTGSKAELESLFSEEFTMNYFNLDAGQYQDTKRIGAVLYNLRSETDDISLIKDYVPFSSSVVLLEVQPDCSSFIAMVQEKGIELSALSLYEQLSADGKKNAAKRISNADFGMDEIDEIFTDSIIFSGIETSEWVNSGVFYEAADISSYNKATIAVREIIQKELTGNNYTDFVELESNIKDIANKYAIKVYSSAGGGGISGGGGRTSKSTPAIQNVLPAEKPTETIENRIVFSDVSETYWGFEAINNMHWQGIVLGYKDMFEPEREITRAEFAALLTRVLSLKDGTKAKFSDVTPGAWYYQNVSALYENEIIIGDGEMFYPDEKITRQDMAVMIDRVVKKAEHSLQYNEKSFADIGLVSGYAVEAVNNIAAAGLMSGMGDGTFAPNKFATRAEATQIIYRLWKNNLSI